MTQSPDDKQPETDSVGIDTPSTATAIYSPINERTDLILIVAVICGLTYWLTAATGMNAWIIAAMAGFTWMAIIINEGTGIESMIVFIIILIIASVISFQIENGFPWSVLVTGFFAALTAPAKRERRKAQRFLNAYGPDEFKKRYGDEYDTDLKPGQPTGEQSDKPDS